MAPRSRHPLGHELLSKPIDALDFATEVEQQGIGILGLHFWYAPGNEYYPGPDCSTMLDADNFARRSVQQAMKVVAHLPDGIVWISFGLAIPLPEEDDCII